MTKTDDVLAQVPPDKLADILAKLEAEKAARAAASPGAPTAVERAFVEVADNVIINAPPAPRQAKPKPRKSKPRAAARPTPTHFIIQTSKPVGGDCGSIAEGHFIVQDGKVFLCDADGAPNGEGHTILHDAAYTARQALRAKLAARQTGVRHERIVYPPTGWR
jgi:hypothetical protein